jgi:hypothetical protein
LTDEEILRVVLESKRLQDACDELVKLANERGGRDNISVIIIGPIAVPESGAKAQEIPTQPEVKDLEATEPLTASSVDWCTVCGLPIVSSSRQCPHCGADLDEAKIPEPNSSAPLK